jgi:hypothetical protein
MRKNRLSRGNRAFTLVMSVALLFMVALIALALLGLSSIELRRSSQSTDQARAKANARLAMMLAIGNLQKQLGPDQRVSAPASQENASSQPHWTGVWSTVAADGTSLWPRDDANGGLSDLRDPSRLKSVRRWLVSGNDITTNFTPNTPLDTTNAVTMVDRGTLGSQAAATDLVKAPLVNLANAPGQRGRYAYWIGDEGIKANIATAHAYEGKIPNPSSPSDGGYFALLNTQEADATAALSGMDLAEQEKARAITSRQWDLVSTVGKTVAQKAFHHASTHSSGVQANVRQGRLKRDLTAFIESNGNFPDLTDRGNLLAPGLSQTDNMIGPANADVAAAEGLNWLNTRHRTTSPRFGLIRDWAKRSAAMSQGELDNVVPISESTAKAIVDSESTLGNLNPASLASYQKSNLSPILVEGSTYFSMSWHNNPPGSPYPHNVRLQTYPRVVLWNPYNVEMTMERSMVMLQVNGRQEMITDGTQRFGNFLFTVRSEWIWFFGGRSTDFSSPQGGGVTNSAGYKDPYIGSFYYSLPKTTIGPGECLVFTPARPAEYNEYALEQNELSCNVSPDVSRCFYFTSSELDGGISFQPTNYWFAPTNYWNIRNQADDQRMMLKSLGSSSQVSPEDFDALPQIAYASCSLQYGGGREPRIAWAATGREPMEYTALVNPQPTQIPNVRTREGYRLRWFQEHPSNLINSGKLKGTPFFQESLLATWNPRAAYASRSPWDNIGGSLPVSGSGGGPWFFGIYTRDLYDQAVSWNDQMPVYRKGRYHGNPFGTPQEGRERTVLFDVPRDDVGVVSLGQLQHAKFSEFVWQPSYAFGNSLVDPRIATGALQGINRTAPKLSGAELSHGGFDANNIGWSSDAQRSTDNDAWARQGRAIYQDFTNQDLLVYDLSYELNYSLWDDFFLSTGNRYAKSQFLNDPVNNPLPNGRMRLNPSTRGTVTEARLMDLHEPARHLMIEGAFNVNSTSIEAWEALLRSSKNLLGNNGGVVFPRVLNAPGGGWTSGTSAMNQNAWDGYRSLSDGEVRLLAEEIVKQVKLRGPFLSMADFVNRRLRDDETGRMGPLQAAIEAAGLNQPFKSTFPLDNRNSLPNYTHPDNISDSTRLEQTLKPDSAAWGVPGYLTQADVLQVIGSTLTPRSDTFRIRAYGEAADDTGAVKARAWCEAVVQRLPDPLQPDATGLNPVKPGSAADFGRRFVVVSFRWLKPEEV